jgi:hypothetical protein
MPTLFGQGVVSRPQHSKEHTVAGSTTKGENREIALMTDKPTHEATGIRMKWLDHWGILHVRVRIECTCGFSAEQDVPKGEKWKAEALRLITTHERVHNKLWPFEPWGRENQCVT